MGGGMYYSVYNAATTSQPLRKKIDYFIPISYLGPSILQMD